MPQALLFDLSATQDLLGSPHGGGIYAKAVFWRLQALQTSGQIINYFYDATRALDQDILNALKQKKTQLYPTYKLTDVQDVLTRSAGCRFYSALCDTYDKLNFSGLDVVITIHGLRPIELPSDAHMTKFGSGAFRRMKDLGRRLFASQYKAARTKQFQRLVTLRAASQTIIVPSRHTKYALLLTYPFLAEDQIQVLPSPPTQTSETTPGELPPEAADAPYFLSLSGGRWQKNTVRTLQAFHLLRQSHCAALDARLIITGGLPQRVPSKFKAGVTVLPYCDEPTLAALLKGATALLYPSLNEGFGYPPLEAMRFGTPVIASSICSLNEILGDAVLYTNPYDIAEIANRCLQIMREPSVVSTLSQKGQAQFSFQKKKQCDALDTLCALLLDDVSHAPSI